MTPAIPRHCVIVTLLCIFTITNLIQSADASYSAYKEIIEDLPIKNDIDFYLSILERIVNFANHHKYYVDIHVCFGLFLINVNLRNIVNNVFLRLPEDLKTRLEHVLYTVDRIISHFQQMVDMAAEKSNPDETPEVFIAELFYKNEKSWIKHLVSFKPNLLMATKFYSSDELEDIYSEWPEYVDKVFDFQSCVPNPEQSLTCLAQLDRSGNYGMNQDMRGARCVPGLNRCNRMILNGTDFGYAMIHRMLYIIMGRFSRGCSVISETIDKHIIDTMCADVYNEADYIAQHESRMPYLAMGQIVLCTLEGHVQFLRRSWINPLLDYQTEFGCFGRADMVSKERTMPTNLDDPEWEIHIREPILGGLCNTPTTGVATSMLAATIRLILEKIYR